MEYLTLATGLFLIAIGLWGAVTRRNIIRIIIGFSLFDTGLHVVIVSLGYIRGKSAPIIDSGLPKGEVADKIVDPIPQAIVLTAIVIGLAITALMLALALKMYEKKKTLNIDELRSNHE